MSVDNDKYLEAAKYWRDKYNGQDREIRFLNAASSISTQINEIQSSKDKAVRAYKSFLKESNDKIIFLKSELIRFKRVD